MNKNVIKNAQETLRSLKYLVHPFLEMFQCTAYPERQAIEAKPSKWCYKGC